MQLLAPFRHTEHREGNFGFGFVGLSHSVPPFGGALVVS